MTGRSDRLARGLRELGMPGREIEETLPAVAALSAWEAPTPTTSETRLLLAALEPQLRRRSPVRRPIEEFHRLIGLALTQVSILRAGFWIGSAALMQVGVLLAFFQDGSSQALILRLVGPLVAYLGTAIGFRAESLGVLEFEFACPVTPRQLTIARLLVIVGYQTVTGVVLSVPLAAWGGGPLPEVTLLWLAPLLFATGLTLLASLWWPVGRCAPAVYASWVTLVVVGWRLGAQGLFDHLALEAALAVAGLALLAAVVVLLPGSLSRKLPAPQQAAW